MKKLHIALICVAVVLLTVLPLWLAGGTATFGGADTHAQEAIGIIAPGYKPWFKPVFEPASDEIASMLFALQAALGAGVIGFWLGLSIARDPVVPAQAGTHGTPAKWQSKDTRPPGSDDQAPPPQDPSAN